MLATRDVNACYNECFVLYLIPGIRLPQSALSSAVAWISLSKSLPCGSRSPYSNANDHDRH